MITPAFPSFQYSLFCAVWQDKAHFSGAAGSYYGRKDVMRVDMTPKEYQAYVKRMQKKSPLGKDMALAFVIGGLICVAGQPSETASGRRPEYGGRRDRHIGVPLCSCRRC